MVLVLWYACLAIVVAKAVRELFYMFAFEFRDNLNPDALIYLTIGRGILNGLLPYKDLFESKPPGIFYLSALSQFLTGGVAISRAWEIATLAFIPVICVNAAWKYRSEYSENATPVVMALLFGTLLTLQSQQLAGGLQSEIIGLLPAVLYAASVVLFAERQSLRWLLLRSTFLLCAIGIREPYLLGLLSTGLLASRTWRDLRHLFLYPLFLGGSIGVLLLVVGGFFVPYLIEYLPAMIQGRVGGTLGDFSLAYRLVWMQPLLGSPSRPGAFALIPFWFFAIVGKEWKTVREFVASSLAIVVSLAVIYEYHVLLVVMKKTGNLGLSAWATFTHPTFWPINLFYVIGSLLYCGFIAALLWRYPRKITQVIFGVAGLLLLGPAIGIAGYAPNYLLYAFPVFVCCLLLYLRTEEYLRPITIVVTIYLSLSMLSTHQTESDQLNLLPDAIHDSTTLSHQLDVILDACGFDRFVFDGNVPAFAFSKHSPIGPVFNLYFHDYLAFTHPFYLQTFDTIKQEGAVLVQPRSPLDKPNPLPPDILRLFSDSVPACAKGLPVPFGFLLKYRKAEL